MDVKGDIARLDRTYSLNSVELAAEHSWSWLCFVDFFLVYYQQLHKELFEQGVL